MYNNIYIVIHQQHQVVSKQSRHNVKRRKRIIQQQSFPCILLPHLHSIIYNIIHEEQLQHDHNNIIYSIIITVYQYYRLVLQRYDIYYDILLLRKGHPFSIQIGNHLRGRETHSHSRTLVVLLERLTRLSSHTTSLAIILYYHDYNIFQSFILPLPQDNILFAQVMIQY